MTPNQLTTEHASPARRLLPALALIATALVVLPATASAETIATHAPPLDLGADDASYAAPGSARQCSGYVAARCTCDETTAYCKKGQYCSVYEHVEAHQFGSCLVGPVTSAVAAPTTPDAPAIEPATYAGVGSTDCAGIVALRCICDGSYPTTTCKKGDYCNVWLTSQCWIGPVVDRLTMDAPSPLALDESAWMAPSYTCRGEVAARCTCPEGSTDQYNRCVEGDYCTLWQSDVCMIGPALLDALTAALGTGLDGLPLGQEASFKLTGNGNCAGYVSTRCTCPDGTQECRKGDYCTLFAYDGDGVRCWIGPIAGLVLTSARAEWPCPLGDTCTELPVQPSNGA